MVCHSKIGLWCIIVKRVVWYHGLYCIIVKGIVLYHSKRGSVISC